jgi:hypothetical protein
MSELTHPAGSPPVGEVPAVRTEHHAQTLKLMPSTRLGDPVSNRFGRFAELDQVRLRQRFHHQFAR